MTETFCHYKYISQSLHFCPCLFPILHRFYKLCCMFYFIIFAPLNLMKSPYKKPGDAGLFI